MSGAVRLQAYCLRSVTPIATRNGGLRVTIYLDMTPDQRFDAVEQLLGVGIGEQAAREGLQRLFPEWFEVTV